MRIFTVQQLRALRMQKLCKWQEQTSVSLKQTETYYSQRLRRGSLERARK